jgi:hypothetical protein
MSSALAQLLDLRDASGRHDIPLSDLRSLQIEAANERFESRIDQIPLLKNRAEAGEMSAVHGPEDLLPLLFAHTTYKTYAERWLIEGQWDRMARWLATVSTFEAGEQSHEGVSSLDEWIKSLEPAGQFVACSSGTTGAPAILGSTWADIDFGAQANVSAFVWGTGVPAAQDRMFLGLGPRTDIARNERTRVALTEAFSSDPDAAYLFRTAPITTGAIMDMILLRRRITDGTATPGDVAEFERLAAERMAGIDEAMADAVEALIKHRDEKLYVSGMFSSLYPIVDAVRQQGYGADDFHPDNALFVGGGLKGADLPPDYRDVICQTLHISDERGYIFYSMQEINTPFPRCRVNRYHISPWVIALPLDTPGEQLLDASDGEIEARAAFFDLSLEGRWGGVISGDRVNIDFGRCSCGGQGPTVGPQITRYADLEGGDKISCAGTIDAYVRGVG